MSVLNWPAGLVPQMFEMALISKTQSFESSLNGSTQTVLLPGDRWSATLGFSNLVGADADALRALLASLRGIAGRLYVPAFDKLTPSGIATGSPLVKGANQTGSSLTTDGWTPNTASILKAGDYLQVNNELKIMTANADSDSGGNATLSFAPPLRVSPADNAAITVNSAAAVMALADNQQVRWAQQPGKIYAITIACSEPLDI